jgi:hypothetical protein
MRFWKTLIPDEPLISHSEAVPPRHTKRIPPAVRGWSVVSIVANGLVAGLSTAISRDAAPLLLGAIFTLFPLYILFFWNDVISMVNTSKQRAIEQSPFAVRINFGVQWIAISVCVGTTAILCITSVVAVARITR